MCRPASFILTKDKVFWSKFSDIHEDIIEEFKLDLDGIKEPNILRVEIYPPNKKDLTTPINNWTFNVEQDITPPWFNWEKDEVRCRLSLVNWINQKIIINKHKTIKNGNFWIYGSSTVKVYGLSTVRVYDTSTVRAYDSSIVASYDLSIVRAYASSIVTAYDSSIVTACDSSIVAAWDSSTVTTWDSSTVTVYDSSTVTSHGLSIITAYDSSTVTAYGLSTVTAYDTSIVETYDSSTVRAYDSSTVRAYSSSIVTACDSSTVATCENESIVKFYSNTSPPIPKTNKGLVICYKEKNIKILKNTSSSLT